MTPKMKLPRVYSGKCPLGKSIFSRAKVRSVTSTNDNDNDNVNDNDDGDDDDDNYNGDNNNNNNASRPQDFTRPFFFAVFFGVTHGGPSGRGTTHP